VSNPNTAIAYDEATVQLTVIINMPVSADNPTFTRSDAIDTAFARVTEAVESHTFGDCSLLSASVIGEIGE
jgi:hypothetical protein